MLLAGVAGAWLIRAHGAAPWGNGAASAATATANGAAAGSAPGGRRGPGREGGNGGGPRAGGADRPQPVAVAAVQRRDIRVTVQAIGTLAAANTAVVRAKVEGELKALHFREGQQVAAGALLAELDDRALRHAAAQADGQLQRDQAQLAHARQDLQRFRELLERDGIARQQVDAQQALVQQLEGTVQISQAAAAQAKLQLSHTRILAPIAGRVGLKQVDIGNIVKPGDAQGLVTIAQTDPLHVVFAVPDVHVNAVLSRLSPEKRVKGALASQDKRSAGLPSQERRSAGLPSQERRSAGLRVEAWDREGRQRLATGEVSATDNAIDTATGTLKLKARIHGAPAGLLPNQFVNVRLQIDTVADGLAVPAAAVLQGADGHHVWRVGDDQQVQRQVVKPGAAEGDWVSVQGPLAAGDRVVIDGVDRLRDGARVAVIDPQAAREPGNAASGPRGDRRRLAAAKSS